MSINVIADNEIGLLSIITQLLAQLLAKELAQDGNSKFFGSSCCACRGFDPQTGNASGHEVLEEVSIIGSHFDDEAVSSELQLRDYFIRIPRRVGKPAGGGAGEVGVI
jgi:hypothetical protein